MILKRERHGAALVLTVNRPAARNAINRKLAEQLCEALAEVASDDSVSSVVLASSRTLGCDLSRRV